MLICHGVDVLGVWSAATRPGVFSIEGDNGVACLHLIISFSRDMMAFILVAFGGFSLRRLRLYSRLFFIFIVFIQVLSPRISWPEIMIFSADTLHLYHG